MNLPFIFRELREADLSFILNSWLTSYRENVAVKYMPTNLYYKEQKWLIMKMLAKSTVIVAANEDDPDQILGFIMFEPNKLQETAVIHYMYVKNTFRKLGVGRELLNLACDESKASEDLPIVVTHISAEFSKFSHKYFVYNPFIKGDYR